MATYTWLDGSVSDIDAMAPEELARYRAEFSARLTIPGPIEPRWEECELCGCGVSPQSKALGMATVHQHCFARLTPKSAVSR